MKVAIQVAFACAILTACSSGSTENPRRGEVAEIDSWLNAMVERQHIPGLTVAATRNDSVVYTGAFGYTNIEGRVPMRPSHVFHWASVSKTFVATAVMQLVEQGKLKLDDRIVDHVPYFKQKGELYKNITIRQMLNHTSGIGDVDDYEWDKPQNDPGAPERYVRGLENDELLFAPGRNWRYSNTAYEILGVLITTVSGMPFETYMRRHIFGPLGMNYSSFMYPEIPDSLRVSGHLWAGKPIVSKVYPYNRIHAPSSTLNSNVVELTHYAVANLHRGKYGDERILADSTYDLLWTNSVNLASKPSVGLSWFIGDHKGMKTLSHGGADTGFRSFLLLVPKKNISVVVACNYEVCRSSDIAHAVLDLLLNHEPEEVKQQIGFAFAEVLLKDGLEQAKRFYHDTKADSAQNKFYLWDEDDAALAYPGYLLLDQGMSDEAIALFNFNAEMNPGSGYAYLHLGRAYARTGNKELARKNFLKAIEQAPAETEFKEALAAFDAG